MTQFPSFTRMKFKTNLPSDNREVWFMPFVTAQEKALLIAQESKDVDVMVKTLEDVISNCVPDLDISKLPVMDSDWLLMHIRSKSVSNVQELKIKDPDTQEFVELSIDIEKDLHVSRKEGHSKTIRVGEDSAVIMRYPTLREFQMFIQSQGDKVKLLNILFACIVAAVHGDEQFDISGATFEEKIAWADENLSDMHIKAISNFFETMPHARYEKKYVNSNGVQKTFVVEGMQSFFS